MAIWNENAKVILESRYLLKDKTGKVIETQDAMLERVAKCVSGAEKEKDRDKWNKEFMSILDTLEFLPNSPTLMNAGTEMGQLSACFLIPVEDNLSAIMEAVKQTALIHKSGGGTGVVFSHIRPSGSIVNTTTGVASGPVSFMKIFDATTGVVKQGGKRRGANIGILSCNHPDILNFIKCKEDTTQFTNFNISVSITDNFMKAVQADNGYPLINPFTKEKTYIKAAEIFHILCEQAWKTGEPGIIFIDTINKTNTVP
jgi:ribonucleoside-diphosphate reductase alpha chain